MRTVMMISIIAIAGGMLLAVHGCGGMRQHPEPVKYYVLHYDPPKPPIAPETGREKPAVIHVERLQARAPYTTRHIIYAESPYQRSKYAYHQWMNPPADMLTPLLIRDIESSAIADAVVPRPAGKAATYRVEGTIIDFYENNEDKRWEAVLVLRLSLTEIDPASRAEKTLFYKTYREVRVLEKNNPHDLARQMSKAMAAVSKQFIHDIKTYFPL